MSVDYKPDYLVQRRLEKLEESDEKMKDALNQLITSNTLMSQTLDRLAELQPVVRDLELKSANNQIVISAVKWMSMTASGSAIAIAFGFFADRL